MIPHIRQADGQIGFYWVTPAGQPAGLPALMTADAEPLRLLPTHLSALDDALIDAARRWGEVLGGGRPVRDGAEAAELTELHAALEGLNCDYAAAERLAGVTTELRAGQIIGTSALLAIRARMATGAAGPVPFDGELATPRPGVMSGHGRFEPVSRETPPPAAVGPAAIAPASVGPATVSPTRIGPGTLSPATLTATVSPATASAGTASPGTLSAATVSPGTASPATASAATASAATASAATVGPGTGQPIPASSGGPAGARGPAKPAAAMTGVPAAAAVSWRGGRWVLAGTDGARYPLTLDMVLHGSGTEKDGALDEHRDALHALTELAAAAEPSAARQPALVIPGPATAGPDLRVLAGALEWLLYDWLMAHRESGRSAAIEIRSGRPADAAMIVQAAAALAGLRSRDAGKPVVPA